MDNDETMTLNERIAEARERGKEAGENAASWVFNGNTDDATYRRVLKGIEDGDPMILDRIAAPGWLSGEWAGESTSELLGDLLDEDDDEGMTGKDTQEIENAYCEAADEAYWDEIERACRYQVKG